MFLFCTEQDQWKLLHLLKITCTLLDILVMEVVVVAGLFYDSIVFFVYFLLLCFISKKSEWEPGEMVNIPSSINDLLQ